MSERSSAGKRALDLQVLKRMAFCKPFLTGKPASGGRLITDYFELEAEDVIKQHFKSSDDEFNVQEVTFARCVNAVKAALIYESPEKPLRRREDTDPYWRERFQAYLNQESVRLDPDIGVYKAKDNYPDVQSYMIDCLKFVRCAATFMRRDLDVQAQQARDNQIRHEAQQQLLEELEAQGCLASYLQCSLPER